MSIESEVTELTQDFQTEEVTTAMDTVNRVVEEVKHCFELRRIPSWSVA